MKWFYVAARPRGGKACSVRSVLACVAGARGCVAAAAGVAYGWSCLSQDRLWARWPLLKHFAINFQYFG